MHKTCRFKPPKPYQRPHPRNELFFLFVGKCRCPGFACGTLPAPLSYDWEYKYIWRSTSRGVWVSSVRLPARVMYYFVARQHEFPYLPLICPFREHFKRLDHSKGTTIFSKGNRCRHRLRENRSSVLPEPCGKHHRYNACSRTLFVGHHKFFLRSVPSSSDGYHVLQEYM